MEEDRDSEGKEGGNWEKRALKDLDFPTQDAEPSRTSVQRSLMI